MVDTNDLARAHPASETEVFISYRNAEGTAPYAQLFDELLRQRQLNVFWDAERIELGDKWRPVISTALTSSKLVVGLVLMTDHWYGHFRKEDEDGQVAVPTFDEGGPSDEDEDTDDAKLRKDVVWWEVDELLSASDAALVPVVLRSKGSGDDPPLVPEDVRFRKGLLRLKERIDPWQHGTIRPRDRASVDAVVDRIVAAANKIALGRPLPFGVTAGQSPPLPLRVLHAEPAIGQRLLEMVTLLERRGRQNRFMTIRGQDALVAHAWDAALSQLRQARDHGGAGPDPAMRVDDDPGWVFRSQLWRIHLQNLYVVASLGGGRPRRLPITVAKDLLDALLCAIEIGADRLGDWPSGDGQQTGTDRTGATYVLHMALDLLWLLWRDFYIERNVRPPDLTDARLATIRGHLRSVAAQLDRSAAEAGIRQAADERHFLLGMNYLEGLKDKVDTAEAWVRGQTFDELSWFVEDEWRRKVLVRSPGELGA